MAGRRLTLAEAAVLVVWSLGLVAVVLASPDCSSSDTLLDPCLNFATGNASSPAASCCSGLKTVVADQPICVCELLGYGGSPVNVSYNLTLAEEIPGLCDIIANPAAECPALIAGAPASSPFGYPEPVSVPPPVSGAPIPNGASKKMPDTILSILQLTAAPAVVSLLLRVCLKA